MLSENILTPKYSRFTVYTSLQNAWGYTPLMGASKTDQADIAKLLLEHKANVDYQDKLVSSTSRNMSDAPVVVLSYCVVVS